MELLELFKVILLGIVEGVTEWLPISSTGHMIIVDKFLTLNASDAFKEMFFVVIQLGAILAVVVIYIKKLIPLEKRDNKLKIKSETMTLWYKIIFACIPAAVIGLLFDDKITEIFYNHKTVSITLILYGIIFIIIEYKKKNSLFHINTLSELTYKAAFIIGLFQVLALIPGTSRSGATIIGAMLIGTSRVIAAEFTFFLAIPIMFGASLLKIIKFGSVFTSSEMITLLLGMTIAFIISIISIKFLMKYIKKNNFKIFGYYRIILGLIVIFIFR